MRTNEENRELEQQKRRIMDRATRDTPPRRMVPKHIEQRIIEKAAAKREKRHLKVGH